jgi:hypothetical protein
MGYLKQYHLDSAYTEPQTPQESRRMYRKRVYNTMLYYTQTQAEAPDMRIRRLWPKEDWDRVWRILNEAPIAEQHTAIWYRVVYDVIRTNVRLFKIRLSSTDRCRYCGNTDTLLHRLTSCGDCVLLWNWTAKTQPP